MSNANFQVGFELKELKVGEIVTFRISTDISMFFFFLNVRNSELATKL